MHPPLFSSSSTCPRVCVCVCVCVCDRERERERKRERNSACKRERERERENERKSVCIRERKREREGESVCVCERECFVPFSKEILYINRLNKTAHNTIWSELLLIITSKRRAKLQSKKETLCLSMNRP